MRTMRAVAVLVAAGAFGLAGCTAGSPEPGAAAPVTGPSASTGAPAAPAASSAGPTGSGPATSTPATATPATATPAGGRTSTPAAGSDLAGYDHAIVTATDPAAGTVTLNVVEYFNGAAAARACAEDGRTSSGAAQCRAYYVRDRNPMLRTLPVAPGASLTVFRSVATGLVRVPGTLAEIGRSDYDLYRMRITGGQVTQLYPEYTP